MEEGLYRDQRPICGVCRHHKQDHQIKWEG